MPVRNYKAVHEKCIKSNEIYTDYYFDADEKILSKNAPNNVVWKRPKEICSDPVFIDNKPDRFDVKQGSSGNCWISAAICSLTQAINIFDNACPLNQSFKDGEYSGVYLFKFCVNGNWLEVFVDDRLPTSNGNLIYMHSSKPNVFWSALLEKAFAKLYGSYEALESGDIIEVMEALTGGIVQNYNLKDFEVSDIFKYLRFAISNNSLLGCYIENGNKVSMTRERNGLIKGLFYSVTEVQSIYTRELSGKRIPCLAIRLRNPYGDEREWRGKWADNSLELSNMPPDMRHDLNISYADDGEFWMDVKDLKAQFSFVKICYVDIGNFDKKSATNEIYKLHTNHGEWSKGLTAGGSESCKDTFWKNPQYQVSLIDPDAAGPETKSGLIVALTQTFRRSRSTVNYLKIGFSIFKMEKDAPSPRLTKEYFDKHPAVARSDFVNEHAVAQHFELPIGNYCIVPCTFNADEEGRFMIRIFTEKSNLTKLTEKTFELKSLDTEEAAPELNYLKAYRKISGVDEKIDRIELLRVIQPQIKKIAHGFIFPEEVCRAMLSMLTMGRDSKIDYEEFKGFHMDLTRWLNAFKTSHTKPGYLNFNELVTALRSSGIALKYDILRQQIMRKYEDTYGLIDIKDFLQVVTRVQSCQKFFELRKKNRIERGRPADSIVLTEEELMRFALPI